MLRQTVEQAACRQDVRDAVSRVYAALQREIDARKPVCCASGRCCRFEEYGHRLYVTTLELAKFVYDQEGRSASWDGSGCPFQVGGLCGVHSIRPFGCRVYFCDSTSGVWQQEQYERFHGELKRLHGELGVEYRYVEWRQALAELGLASQAARSQAEPPGRRLSLPQLPL